MFSPALPRENRAPDSIRPLPAGAKAILKALRLSACLACRWQTVRSQLRMKSPRKGDTQGVSSQGPHYSRLCKRYMSTQRSAPPCGLSKGGTRARPNGSAPSPSTPSARALTFPPVSTPSVAPEPGRLTVQALAAVPTLRSRAVLGTLLSTPAGVDHGADPGWTAQRVQPCEEQSPGRATRAEAPASRDSALCGGTVGAGWTRAGPRSKECEEDLGD